MYEKFFESFEFDCSNDESNGMVTNGRLPLMWAQSLYVIGCLLKDKQVAIGELDPINRRLTSQPRPETIVQVNKYARAPKIQQICEFKFCMFSQLFTLLMILGCNIG